MFPLVDPLLTVCTPHPRYNKQRKKSIHSGSPTAMLSPRYTGLMRTQSSENFASSPEDDTSPKASHHNSRNNSANLPGAHLARPQSVE